MLVIEHIVRILENTNGLFARRVVPLPKTIRASDKVRCTGTHGDTARWQRRHGLMKLNNRFERHRPLFICVFVRDQFWPCKHQPCGKLEKAVKNLFAKCLICSIQISRPVLCILFGKPHAACKQQCLINVLAAF